MEESLLVVGELLQLAENDAVELTVGKGRIPMPF